MQRNKNIKYFVNRSDITGRFVSEQYANRYPQRTRSDLVKRLAVRNERGQFVSSN